MKILLSSFHPVTTLGLHLNQFQQLRAKNDLPYFPCYFLMYKSSFFNAYIIIHFKLRWIHGNKDDDSSNYSKGLYKEVAKGKFFIHIYALHAWFIRWWCHSAKHISQHFVTVWVLSQSYIIWVNLKKLMHHQKIKKARGNKILLIQRTELRWKSILPEGPFT